jgi:hypothetical protein
MRTMGLFTSKADVQHVHQSFVPQLRKEMLNSESFASWNLHDGELQSIQIDWEKRLCRLMLSAFLDQGRDAVECTIVFDRVADIQIPHRAPWGESVFINSQHVSGNETFVVEMQSGDEIRISADSATLTRQSSTP